MPRPSHRIEHDLLGELSLPADAYYGVQTARALENFNISGVELRLYPDVIRGLAMVKLAAARANFDCGVFSREILDGIEASCAELMDGKLHDQFRLDVFQGGAGTSTNMNANEVIANRALELMGHKKGEYKFCDPHDHINASQSTNDAYPTALHVALALGNIRLVAAVNTLIAAFRAKGREFAGIVKMGRTQLQDAVPMTLGQEFNAFGETLGGEVRALQVLQNVLCETNMGATAIGTGLNAPPGYAEKCTAHLAEISGFPIRLAADLIEATQDTQAFVLYSSGMKSLAIKLSKICNDLRLLSSGPRCGLREINLPAKQPGSSIMPGKVNPVIPEVVNMVCFRVIGSDMTVTLAAEGGQLQLNVFEPVIAACLFEAQTMFINAANTLRTQCVDGITANEDVCRHYVEYSIGTVTALNPVIGYERATALATEAMRTGRGILELVREQRILSDEQLAAVFDPMAMTGQGTVYVNSRTVAPAVALAALVTIGCTRETASATPGQDGWYTFDGTWSATGVRQTLPIDPAGRVAAIVQLAGAVAITTDDWIGRGFHGELIGFDDGHARSTGRWVWTDDRGDRVFGDVGGDPIQAGRRFAGTITGGSGRYAGISGQVEFVWQYLVEADDGVVQGRATGIKGRYRRGGGQP